MFFKIQCSIHSTSVTMIQLPQREKPVKMNISEMFCCYMTRSVIIAETSYCVDCASQLTDQIHMADIRFQHNTLNELAARQAPLYDGANRCNKCDCFLITVNDAADCDDCVESICALYRVAIADGVIDVVTETKV